MKYKGGDVLNNMYREVIYGKKTNRVSNNASRTGRMIRQPFESYPEYKSTPIKKVITNAVANPDDFAYDMPAEKSVSANSKADEESLIYKEEISENAFQLSLDKEDILKGIILSEILGKPKSKRRGL